MTSIEQNITKPILVTGAAAGKIGGVGFKIVELLRKKGYPVRAMVRTIDDRVKALRDLGAEVVQGDLTNIDDVRRVIDGCSRIYFGMAVSETYLEATLNVAAVAKHFGNVEVIVNMSQMTVSSMSVTETTESRQQKQHWLSEQALNWSGLPVVHVRPTVFMEHPFFTFFAADSIKKSGEIRLPIGSGKTSPISTQDIARVVLLIVGNRLMDNASVKILVFPKRRFYNVNKHILFLLTVS
jgi:NAD(P)H dehydrogenase (quinone)